MEDSAIVELFWSRNETAIEKTEKKYGGKLRTLATKLLYSIEDAEECVNDTYLTAWNSIPPQRPQYLFAYLAKICRFSAYGKLDWKNAQKRRSEIVALTAELESCIPSHTEGDALGEEIGQILNGFLTSLPKEKRLIFMRRYWYEDAIGDIAKRYGITESKVKTSLLRTRNALRSYLEKEGIGT